MRGKKRVALLITLLLLVLSVPACATSSTFTDITDAKTAENVEVLQTMGVIQGVSPYSFDPNGQLTRAQFAKMAIMVLNKGNLVSSYKSYTIFPDVKSSHWASGYVNLAVRGEHKFIAGFADGTFGPDQKITFGQAVTILMRLLGYADTDVGMIWPTGYLNAAASEGLTDGVSLKGDSSITRAQAAQLFVNLLNTVTKEGGNTFAQSVAATNEKDVILVDANAQADDGGLAIETNAGTVKLAGDHQPLLLQGRRGTVLFDAKGSVWGFVPSTVGTTKNIVVSSAKAGTIVDKNGKEYTLTADVDAYYKGEKKTYGEVFVNLRSGTRVTLHLGLTGKVEAVYVAGASSEEAIIIGKDGSGNGLITLTGGRTDYSIYRHGEKVSASALRRYDVATYISEENEIQISTFRLSGRYDNAYPNTDAPTKVKLLGYEFDVLPCAVSSLGDFKIGDQMTLLLTEDGKIAGAANPKQVKADAVGIAKVDASGVKVELMEGITLEGKADSNYDDYNGLLVKISAWRADYLSLNPVRENQSTNSLDLTKKQLGSADLAADVKIYERVKTGPVVAIELNDIRMTSAPRKHILYSRYNDNGDVDLLILDNVTGDRYAYGRIITTYQMETTEFNGIRETRKLSYTTLKNPNGDLGPYLKFFDTNNLWVGIVIDQKAEKIVSQVSLTKITGVTNENWESDEVVSIQSRRYEVSDEVVCYNADTKEWIKLDQARSLDGKMTLFVDEFDVIRGIEVH